MHHLSEAAQFGCSLLKVYPRDAAGAAKTLRETAGIPSRLPAGLLRSTSRCIRRSLIKNAAAALRLLCPATPAAARDTTSAAARTQRSTATLRHDAPLVSPAPSPLCRLFFAVLRAARTRPAFTHLPSKARAVYHDVFAAVPATRMKHQLLHDLVTARAVVPQSTGPGGRAKFLPTETETFTWDWRKCPGCNGFSPGSRGPVISALFILIAVQRSPRFPS